MLLLLFFYFRCGLEEGFGNSVSKGRRTRKGRGVEQKQNKEKKEREGNGCGTSASSWVPHAGVGLVEKHMVGTL